MTDRFGGFGRPSMLFAAGSFAAGAFAGPAHAATNLTVDYTASDAGTPITIGGNPTNQYTFKSGPFISSTTKASLEGNGNALVGPGSDTPYYPTPGDASLSSSQDTYISAANFPDSYYGLTFDISGAPQTGYAFLDQGGIHVREISYQPASAGPEPDAWALMIVGFGGIGAALRHQRRRQRERAALAA